MEKIIEQLKNSRRAEERMFYARNLKTIIEIYDIFLERKELLKENLIYEAENNRNKIIKELSEYKIYEIH